MIELPEAIRLARQMSEEIKGRRIEQCICGHSPHKWVFYSRPTEEYESILPGRRIGESRAEGSHVDTAVGGGYTLQLGDGGERVLLHAEGAKPPAKHHLLLRFADGCMLTVTVQGWGAVRLFDRGQLREWRRKEGGLSPIDDSMTLARFKEALAEHEAECDKSIKAFFVNRPRIKGIGNGYLQDILFGAGIHPTRKVRQIAAGERRKLHSAMRKVLTEAIARGGRDDEHDLHGEPGRYRRILSAKAKGKPCPKCGAAIEKIAYLGGACYFCPDCQT